MIQSPRKTDENSHRTLTTLGPILAIMAILALGCSDGIDARLDEAYALQEAGHLERSILAMQGILRDDPGNKQANFLIGTALVQSDRRIRAIPHLTEATNSDLYAVPAGLLLASTQYRIKAYDDAIESSRRVLAIDPDNLTAFYTLGRSALASGQPDIALRQALRILEVRSEAQNAVILQGNALVALGRADEAERLWLDLRQLTASAGNPNDAARACAELGLFYQSQGMQTQTETTYAECLDEFPTHSYLQDSASDFHVQRSEPEKAISVHRRAAQSSPENFQVWSRFAAIMYLHANHTETHQLYLQIVERFDTPEAWRLIADFYQKTRHTTAARKAIEEALIRSDQPSEAFLFFLAELLVEEGNHERARKIGERLTKPSYRQLLAGTLSLDAGNPKQALKHFDAGLRLWPNNPHARYQAGRAALELQYHERAISAFGAAILVGAGTTDAALRLAEIHFADRNWMPARGFAKHQIAQRPYLDATPYHIAIRSALRLGRLADAKAILTSLRILDHGLSVISETIAIKRFEDGARASSEFVRKSGVDLGDPANESILRAYSDDLNALGRTEEALRLVDAAILRIQNPKAASSNAAPLHDLRSRVLSQLGRVEEATASIKHALTIDPGYAPALETRASLALHAGDSQTALAALDAASAAEPMEARYVYSAAGIADDLGDIPGFVQRLEETLARRPTHGMAANDLAWALATDRRDLDRALELAELAALRLRSAKTLGTLGWAHHRRGDYAEAIANYRFALESDATLLAIRYRLGLALGESGEIDEARKVLDELIRGPEFPELEAARIELARLQGS
jgi:tetratricopeptide (TPR) repeat protein